MIMRDSPCAEILAGASYPLGVSVTDQGSNVAVYSPAATAIEVCFFDESDIETARYRLWARTGDIWHGFIADMHAGQRYGFRAQGPFEPTAGLWFNPNKVLLDPYAYEITRPIESHDSLYSFDQGVTEHLTLDETDNAPFVPKSVVPTLDAYTWRSQQPTIAWRDTVLYEVHVKGFTQRHPDVPEELRGTYLGLAHESSIAHIKSLGITSVELMPCFAFMSEPRLKNLGLTNYWGYNPALFFAPEPRYAKDNAVHEFKVLVNALNEAGIEVILDVVYNHTAEGGFLGPTLSNKGLHAKEYYRSFDDDPAHYIDNSGCGNSVNSHNTHVLRMILDSMRHWMSEYHVSGFRFDLAASLGREHCDYSNEAAFFKAIAQDPILCRGKMIAEPWDIGRGGYQVGNFPEQWYECNDKFRDTVRRFWKGDHGMIGDFATRLMGSSDVFQKGTIRRSASVNYVAYHDGFTLHDLVSYNQRHNEANMERNLDGHGNNLSYNYGEEGPSQDPDIIQLRRQQKRNMLATLMLSQGAIHLLAGDEFGRTQQGNNNAYCQDNDLSWLQWAERDEALEKFTSQLIGLRQSSSLFRDLLLIDQQNEALPFSSDEVHWYRPDGHLMEIKDWHEPSFQSFGVLLSTRLVDPEHEFTQCDAYYLVLFNASDRDVTFKMPFSPEAGWAVLCDTARNDGLISPETPKIQQSFSLLAHSVVVLGKPD